MRQAITPNFDSPDISETALKNDPTLKIDPQDPIEPIESTEPYEPILRTEFFDPIESTEFFEAKLIKDSLMTAG